MRNKLNMKTRVIVLGGLLALSWRVVLADEIWLFSGVDFTGRKAVASQSIADLREARFSAVRVIEGTWEVCEEAQFGGVCTLLFPGDYANVARITARIASVRPLTVSRDPKVEVLPTPSPSDSTTVIATATESRLKLIREKYASRIASLSDQLSTSTSELLQASAILGRAYDPKVDGINVFKRIGDEARASGVHRNARETIDGLQQALAATIVLRDAELAAAAAGAK